jgi:hypothetical protein
VRILDPFADLTPSLRSVEIEDNDRLADKATIVLGDPQGFTREGVRRGLQIVVDVGWQDEHTPIFHGKISTVGDSSSGSGSSMTVVAYDMSIIMHHAPGRSYGPGTLEDVLRDVISYYSDLGIGELRLDSNPQFDERQTPPASMTDLQYLQYLALKYRARAFVEYVPGADVTGQSKFYFISERELASRTPEARLRCCGGFQELINFDFQRVATQQTPFRPATVMNPQTGEASTSDPGPRPPDPPPEPDPSRDAAADTLGTGGSARSMAQVGSAGAANEAAMVQQLRTAGLPSDPQLAELMSRPDPTTLLGLRGQGNVVGNVNLRAKSMVRISGITSYAAGNWYVRVARHKVQNGNYTTEILVTR